MTLDDERTMWGVVVRTALLPHGPHAAELDRFRAPPPQAGPPVP